MNKNYFIFCTLLKNVGFLLVPRLFSAPNRWRSNLSLNFIQKKNQNDVCHILLQVKVPYVLLRYIRGNFLVKKSRGRIVPGIIVSGRIDSGKNCTGIMVSGKNCLEGELSPERIILRRILGLELSRGRHYGKVVSLKNCTDLELSVMYISLLSWATLNSLS